MTRRKTPMLLLTTSLAALNTYAFAQAAPGAAPVGEACRADSGRPCGPLADDAVVERRGVAPNLEGRGGPTPGDPFRISVDGRPEAAGAGSLEADIRRQADLALAASEVRVQVTTLDAKPVLSVVAAKPAVGPGEAAEFFAFANYQAFIDRAELRIFEAGDRIDAAPRTIVPVQLDRPIRWTPDTSNDRVLRFILRVYDKQGRFDETEASSLAVRASFVASSLRPRTGPLLESQRRIGNIPVHGAEVTVSGTSSAEARVTALGQTLPAGRDGRFVLQQIVPLDTREVDVRLEAPGREPVTLTRRVDLPRRDQFVVALADLTVGHRSFGDGGRPVLGSEDDTRKDFADGRLAFYYRGQISPRWKVTAQADTGEQRLSDLFDNFGEKDPRSLLRRIDPERHYPIYGDDSVTVEDAPTSGRFYFRAEGPNAQAMWGNFKTDLGDTDLLRFQRGLYGGRAEWWSQDATSAGERRTEILGFAADPGTVGSREEFASTGGSVYYLRNQDVAVGSERVFLEVRDKDSGLVLERTELVDARDYEVNYLQGRILLRQPAPITAEAGEFIRSSSLSGHPVWVVVTYEYVPGLTRPDAMTYGGRVQHWVGDHVRLGASAYRQGEDQARQEVQGVDVMLRYRPGTYLRGEFARSDGSSTDTLLSSYGGLDFTSVRAGGENANAYILEGEADLADLNAALKGRIQAYWRNREAGFSAPGELTFGESLQQFGGKAEIELGHGVTLNAKADIVDGDLTAREAIEAGLRRELDSGWFGSVGVRADKQQGQATAFSPFPEVADQIGRRTDAAVQLGYRSAGRAATPELEARRPWAAFVFGQKTLERDGGRLSNDRYGAGGDVQLTERLRVKGELSDGDLGFGADVRTDFAVSDRGSVYLSYALAGENPDAFFPGRTGRLTGGAKYRFTDQISAFVEERYEHGAGPTGLTQSYGVDFAPLEDWTFGLRYETGRLDDAVGHAIERSAAGLTVDYVDERLRWSSTLEYRREDGEQFGERDTWTTRNTAMWRVDEALRLFAKANVSISQGDADANALDADFYEVAVAAAYRPVDNDRLNLLAKYTYLYDLPSPGQIDALGLNLDYAQRSHVLAVDGSYQVTPRLEVGAKVAYRLGELRASRDASAPWFESRALFAAVRADYRIVKEWDVLVEARTLSITNLDDRRAGALVAVYRHLGDHVKVGVGYNFTDYSDDLTDLSYDERGVFLNLLAKF